MPDVIMLKAFIGNRQYDLCRDLDPDLLRASHGVQSLCSAMMSAVWEMTMEIAQEVHKERRSGYEPVVVDCGRETLPRFSTNHKEEPNDMR